mgnify:CR=1 FL=1
MGQAVNQSLARLSCFGMEGIPIPVEAVRKTMLRKIGQLFVIKTSLEAYLIIYALALGAVERGSIYLARFPGIGGLLLFLACTGTVFMAGAKILDCVKLERDLAQFPAH